MRYIEQISEDEVIAHFLSHELASDRFGKIIRACLETTGISPDTLKHPNLLSDQENRYRSEVLTRYRGWSSRTDFFEDFPDDVRWHRYGLTRDELRHVHYMDYSYWIELSGGTRSPVQAAERIMNGKTAYGVDNHAFLDAAETFRRGAIFPEMIMVGTDEASTLVLLEGHLRLTAMCLAPEFIPAETRVIVGWSSNMQRWMSTI